MMSAFRYRLVMVIILVWLFILYSALSAKTFETRQVMIQPGTEASAIELNIVQLFKERLQERGIKTSVLGADRKVGNDRSFQILFGVSDRHPALANILTEHRIPELTHLAPGPEGFLLKMVHQNKQPVLLLAGVDERGCLYGVGELLRQGLDHYGKLVLPDDLHIRSAPAFEIRGTQYGQSGVAKRLADVRDWTHEETKRVILDYALAGANIFNTRPGPVFDMLKSYGLMTQGGFGANTSGRDIPDEWHARESIGRLGYACLSVPEAREYMLEKCEQTFKSSPTYDLVKFHGGDGGGCECEMCDPYGLTFIQTVAEMADIIHQYHPETRIYFTNQKFDNADDNAIFDYLREQPRDWLWAWGFGPGSDATTWQPGHRQTHRMDLFRYPGFGPYGLYPQEILHQLPPQHDLVYYNEITHWRYSQHGYIQMYPRADRKGDQPTHWSHEIYERRPDQFLTMVYDRLTFFAWPRYYHRVFNDLMRYGVGDITHSSGHHDHFNQWMWQRLLWSPRMTVEQVVDEYCQTWFGPEAAPDMARAIFQLEENLQEQPDNPLPEKTGIDAFYQLVQTAGEKMPAERMKTNWLWRMFMQKACLDKYVQLAVQQQIDLQKRIENRVAEMLTGAASTREIESLLDVFDELQETREMIELRETAGRLGQESDRLFGVRSEGYFNLEHDFIGLGWLKRQLQRARASGPTERKERLRMIFDYGNPGEGGYYDNLGTSNPAPHVVFGYPYDHGQPYVSQMLSEGNRPSQRSMHFTQDEDQGVTLHYRNLDPEASYKVRFTLVRPWFQDRYAHRMNQKSQAIYADDIVLAQNLELPLQMSDFFSFDIPRSVTKDGELFIRLEKAPDVATGDRVTVEQWRNSGGWGTLVSEVWLIKE